MMMMKKKGAIIERAFLKVVTIALLVFVDSSVAQQAHLQSIPGEYVISIRNEHLQVKAFDELEEASGEKLAVTDSSVAGIKVEIPEIKYAGNKRELKNDICGKLRKHERRRRQAKEAIVRRFSRHCDENGYFQASATPNDEYMSSLWGLQRMQMSTVWNSTVGSNEVVVAVVDTGINYNHPDLTGNLWQNPGEIHGNGIDDDGNGYVDDVYGWNAINGTGNPMDDNGHGTHVAGTIGARTNNGIGVAGMNWNIKMIGSKFLSASGSGSLWDAVNALTYVRVLKERGVNVVATNNSWGGGGYYHALYDEINRAKSAGILFIAAAGNSAGNNDAVPSYPASYDLDNIISVAAIDSNGSLASFSCYGATSVDIAAPGVNIASTWLNNSYVYLNGTSMATPHVTGAIALLKAYSAGLTSDQLRTKILSTAIYNPGLQGKVSTNGELNLLTAIQNSPHNPSVAGTATPTPTATSTPTITPTATATPIPPTPTPTMTPIAGDWTLKIQGEGLTGLGQVSVSVSGPNEYASSRTTGADGTLTIANLSGGNYTATFSKNGYSFQPAQLQFRVNGATLSLVSAVRTTYLLKAVVLNKIDAAPISNSAVDVYIDGAFVATTISNQSGNVVYPAPFGASYRMEVSGDGYYTERITGGITGTVTRTVALTPD